MPTTRTSVPARTRRPWLFAAAGAVLAAALLGSVALSHTRPRARAGERPAPLPSPSAPQRATLRAVVRNLASHYYGTADVAFGDVVAAHRLEANRLLFGTRLRPSGGADPAVYVVQATGRFLVHEPPGRRGLKPRVDTALTVLVDLKERAVVDFGIAPRRPDLGLLGAPERL